jgi:hypothetical protein
MSAPWCVARGRTPTPRTIFLPLRLPRLAAVVVCNARRHIAPYRQVTVEGKDKAMLLMSLTGGLGSAGLTVVSASIASDEVRLLS